MVMDMLIYFQVFLAGWVCCHFYMVWKLRQALKKVAEDNGMTLDEMAETFLETRGIQTITVPNYFTETTGSSILLYNKDTGDFVSQALSLDELAENVYQFNRVKFALVKHNDLQVWFVEGKIKNDLKELE
jgi:hypothetical protein